MTDSSALPAELAALFPDGGIGRRLSVPPPDGRPMKADPSMLGPQAVRADAPVFWMSDRPVTGETWAAFHAEHPRSGLWPLLLLQDEGKGRPWETGELYPGAWAGPRR